MNDNDQKKNVESKLDSLWRNVKTYRSSKQYMEVLNACVNFRDLAPYNALLVELQRPGAQYVLSESEWRNRYDRGIKPNAIPIIVLFPFGPVDFLFEIGDTYPLNTQLFTIDENKIIEELAAPYKTKNNVSDKDLDRLISNLGVHGIYIDDKMVAGADYAAKIQILEGQPYKIPVYINKKITINWPAYYLLSVNKNAEKGECFASICHELGHLFCYHLRCLGNVDPWCVRIPPYAVKEFEAESVSWLICERLGIGNPSEKYLSNYVSDNNEIPPGISIERVLSAANEIWKLCTLNLSYREGLLYKHCGDFVEEVKKRRDE